MTVVAAHYYKDGRRIAPVQLDSAALGYAEADFAWIGLFEPDAEEMGRCARLFGLHPLAVEDALSTRQQSKVEVYGDQLFVVARTAHLTDNDEIHYGVTYAFVARDFIITVRHGSAEGHSELRAKLETQPRLLALGVDYVLHAVLDLILDNLFPVVEQVEGAVDALEEQTLGTGLTRDDVTRLFKLRRQLLHFQRSMLPMEDMLGKLANLDLPAIDVEARPYFRDILDHAQRIGSMIGLLRDVLGSVLETGLLFEQQRQGDITRQLAAWAAILAVPTAIAGIYGMNFDVMPELRWRYGYPMVLTMTAAICGLLYRRFKRIGWL